MRREGSKPGFTLVELMVTVAVIAAAAAITVPSITQAIRDRRVQQTAIDFLQGFREARGRAMMRGRAHLVIVDLSNSSAPSQRIVEGTTSSCRLSKFLEPTNLVWQSDNLSVSGMSVEALGPTVTYVEYCYSPGGRMLYRYASGAVFADSGTDPTGGDIGGGFMFRVYDRTNLNLLPRRVFVPLGGVPRLAQ